MRKKAPPPAARRPARRKQGQITPAMRELDAELEGLRQFAELSGPREPVAPEVADHILARHARRYANAKTRNALDAWFAYRACRGQGLPIEPWVLLYFDRVADQFQLAMWRHERAATRERVWPKDPAVAVAEAVEMKAPGKSGAGTVFSKYNDREHREYAARVALVALHEKGSKPYLAIDALAESNVASKSTLNRAWKKHGADWWPLSEKAARNLAYLLGHQGRMKALAVKKSPTS